MRDELETVIIAREVERCEDSEDLAVILKKYDEYYLCWQSCVNRLLDESGLSYARFAEKCGISKNTVKKWCREGGAPRSRNTFLKIGFGLAMNREEVNRLLVRYGGYHELNSRDLFDAVCIYALTRRVAGEERYTYNNTVELYDRCVRAAERGGPEGKGGELFLETVMAEEQLGRLSSEEDMVRFAAENRSLFAGKGRKLANCISDYLLAKWPEKNVSASLAVIGIPRRFEKILSELFVHGAIPRREPLIALAIRLEMTPEETNRLLSLAGMEGLCAKDRMECVIIYALQQISLLHPEVPLGNAMELMAVTGDPELRRRCREIVEEYMSNCYQCSADELNSVSDYIRILLQSLDLTEAGELLELI